MLVGQTEVTHTGLDTQDRRARLVAAISAILFVGWVVAAGVNVPVAFTLGVPTVAVQLGLITWALAISIALCRRSWGIPIARKWGGVWTQMELWALVRIVLGGGGSTRLSIGITVAAFILGSWGQRGDPVAAQHRVATDGAAPRR
jgi:hypothetical protein